MILDVIFDYDIDRSGNVLGLKVFFPIAINHSLILSREGLILTLSILPSPEEWIS